MFVHLDFIAAIIFQEPVIHLLLAILKMRISTCNSSVFDMAYIRKNDTLKVSRTIQIRMGIYKQKYSIMIIFAANWYNFMLLFYFSVLLLT